MWRKVDKHGMLQKMDVYCSDVDVVTFRYVRPSSGLGYSSCFNDGHFQNGETGGRQQGEGWLGWVVDFLFYRQGVYQTGNGTACVWSRPVSTGL